MFIRGVEKIMDGKGSYSHCGLVVRGSDFPSNSPLYSSTSIYILESTQSGRMTDGVVSIMDGKAHLGVQLRDLDKVVCEYGKFKGAEIAWCPLISTVLSKKMLDIRYDIDKSRFEWERVLFEYVGTGYDADFVDLCAAAGMPCCRSLRDSGCFKKFIQNFCMRRLLCCCLCPVFRRYVGMDESSPMITDQDKEKRKNPSRWLFCSELVASIYRDMGLFPSDLVASDVMPVDFLPSEDHVGETLDRDKKVPLVVHSPIIICSSSDT
jgi:hypothetical protein